MEDKDNKEIYQIEATVEKFDLDEKGSIKINLKGCGSPLVFLLFLTYNYNDG